MQQLATAVVRVFPLVAREGAHVENLAHTLRRRHAPQSVMSLERALAPEQVERGWRHKGLVEFHVGLWNDSG